MSNPFIELRGVTVRHTPSSSAVLEDLDFSLNLGQRLGLIGANGSGKTTLFSTIMGLVRPENGSVLFQGQELFADKDFRQLRRETGLLFQDADDQLFSPTVLEDVAFGPLNLGLSPAEAKERAVETLARLGLAGFEERVTHKLSGGEKKLTALATILAMQPKALLLDEPTNDLDPGTRERLVQILNELDMALVVISHDWDFLERTTRETLCLENGKLGDGHAVLHAHVHAHPAGAAPHVHENGSGHDHHDHSHGSTEEPGQAG